MPQLAGADVRVVRDDGAAFRYTVSPDGIAPYSTIEAAIAQAVTDGLGPTQPAEIFLMPGTYTTTVLTDVPGNLTIRGSSKGAVTLEPGATSFFRCTGDNCFFEELSFVGVGNGQCCIDGNDHSNVHIRRCDYGFNVSNALGGLFRNAGATWERAFIEHCNVDWDQTIGNVVELENTAAAARDVKFMATNLHVEMPAVSSASAAILNRGCQGVRVRHSHFIGNASMLAVDTDLSGVTGVPNAEVSHCWIGPDPSAGGTPFGLRVGAGTELYARDCFYAPGRAIENGTLIETGGLYRGIGGWTYSADSTPDTKGEMYASNTLASGTGTLAFYQDSLEGNRLIGPLSGVGRKTKLVLRSLEDFGTAHTFEVTGVTVAAEYVQYSVTYIEGTGDTTWANSNAWALEIVPQLDELAHHLFRYDATSTTPSGVDGTLRFNNADPSLATAAYFAADDLNNGDMRTPLGYIDPGTIIYLVKANDRRQRIRLEPSSAADAGSYSQLNFTVEAPYFVPGTTIEDESDWYVEFGPRVRSGGGTPLLQLNERTSVPGATSGVGKYLVRGDTPNSAWFLNDSGEATSLGTNLVVFNGTLDFADTTDVWYSWNRGGPDYDFEWDVLRGGSTGASATTPDYPSNDADYFFPSKLAIGDPFFIRFRNINVKLTIQVASGIVNACFAAKWYRIEDSASALSQGYNVARASRSIPSAAPRTYQWNMSFDDDEVQGPGHLHLYYANTGTVTGDDAQAECSISVLYEIYRTSF